MNRVIILGIVAVVVTVIVALITRGDDELLAPATAPTEEIQASLIEEEQPEEISTVPIEDIEPVMPVVPVAVEPSIVPPASEIPPESSPRLRVHGQVTTTDDVPVAHAVVTLSNAVEGLDVIVAETRTSVDGRYEFIQPDWVWLDERANSIYVAAESPGLSTGLRRRGVTPDEPTIEVDITLAEGTVITGHVIWNTGEAVPNADMIVFRSGDDSGSVATGRTDGQGRFEIGGISAATVTIAVAPGEGAYQHGGHHPADEGEEIEVTLIPRIGVVTGQMIMGVSREPQPGETIYLGDYVSGYRSWSTVTDSEARFRFESVPLESWTLTAPEITDHTQSVRLDESDPETEVLFSIPEPVTISGVVTNRQSREPQPGVVLSIAGRTGYASTRGEPVLVTTDEVGGFEAEGVMVAYADEGRERFYLNEGFNILVRAEGPPWTFFNGDTESRITLSTVEELQSVDLTVIDGNSIEVIARDDVDAPLEGVRVLFENQSIHYAEQSRTNDHGRVIIASAGPPDGLRVLGIHSQWPLLASEPVTPEQTNVTIRPVVVMVVDVSVVEEDGTPVPSPTVYGVVDEFSHPTRNPRQFFYEEADEQGTIRLERVPRCRVVLRAAVRDEESRVRRRTEREIDFGAADAPSEVALVMEAAETITIRGRVVDESGQPISNAAVSNNRDRTSPNRTTVFTGGDGRFSTEVIDAGYGFFVSAVADGHMEGRWISDSAPTTGEEITIELASGYRIRGLVTRSDGTVVSSGSLTLWIPQREEWSSDWKSSFRGNLEYSPRRDGADGFEMQAPMEGIGEIATPAWILVAESQSQVAVADMMLDPLGNRDIDVGTLVVGPTASLTGTVTDASGAPLENVRVAWESGLAIFMPGSARPLSMGVLSDAEGTYTIESVPPGRWAFSATKEGFAAQRFDLDVDGEIEHDFVMVPAEGGTVTIRVTAPGEVLRHSASSMRGDASGGTISTIDPPADGVHVHENIPPGPHVFGTGFDLDNAHYSVGYRIDVEPGDQTVVVDFTDWLPLEMQVLHQGNPIINTEMNFFTVDEREDDLTRLYVTAVTDSEGRMRILSPMGDFRIRPDVDSGIYLNRSITVSGEETFIVELDENWTGE